MYFADLVYVFNASMWHVYVNAEQVFQSIILQIHSITYVVYLFPNIASQLTFCTVKLKAIQSV